MKNILLIAALSLCGSAHAQLLASDIFLENTTNCDVTLELLANDPGLYGTCDFGSNLVSLPALSNQPFLDQCDFETVWGWATSPGSLCPTPGSPAFSFTDVRVAFGTCYSYGTPVCSAPVGSVLVSNPNTGGCYSASSTWNDGCLYVDFLTPANSPTTYRTFIKIHR